MGGDDDSERVLWDRAREGDAEAFGRLFDLHGDRVFRHGYRILGDPADAEDAAAVAFLELWRRRAHVRVVDGSVLPWLLVATTNASRNLARSRRRYRRLIESLPHGEHRSSAEDSVMAATIDTDLAAALLRLSPADARLLALVAMEAYSVADAALVLGISPGAARTRLHRVRTNVQRHLGHTTLHGYLSKEAT